MKSNKILVAIAEDKQEDIKIIKKAFADLPQYEITITATSGRELITKLSKQKKQIPHLVLMDMQMPCGDGLITTTICKQLHKNLKIAGLSTHTFEPLINEFMAEGGCGFLSKFIVQSDIALSRTIYKDPAIFEKALHQLLNDDKPYFDPLCNYANGDYKKINSTQKIISKKYSDLSKNHILYLQLNAANFSQEDMADIICVTPITIKRYSAYLCKMFQAKNHIDLANITIMLGIAKIATLYQKFDL